MLMDTSDTLLADAARAGDRAAFGVLVARHYDRLHALAWRLTGSSSEADDLTQDICASLPARLGGFRGEARFTTWLYRVAVNAAHDARRRRATHARAAIGWGDWELARQDAMAQDRAAQDWLATAMRSLPEDLRDTLALVMGEAMTQAQAAEVLGLSEGTVAWRMSEVKRRLRVLAAQEGTP